VRQLKHWRAADPAGVWAELLQAACAEPRVAAYLHSIVAAALRHGMPPVVKESVLLPFLKRGDSGDPNNYRGIQLISLLRKLLALILSADLSRLLEPGLLEYQCGFRPQRGCADQLFTLRKISELSIEWQQRLYLAFVDLRKAFDSIPRPALWAVLRARGVPEALLNAVVDLHTDTTCRVRVGGARSRAFGMAYGVQQGCPLASVLFNVFFDTVVREALAAPGCEGAGVTLRRRAAMEAELAQPQSGAAAERAALVELEIPVLMLADDLVILAPTAEALQRVLAALEAACRRWGLIISTDKTELMLAGGAAALACEACGSPQCAAAMLVCDGCERAWHGSCLTRPHERAPGDAWLCPHCEAAGGPRGDAWRPPVTVAGRQLAWVDKFKYLGSIFHESGSLACDLARRVQLAAAAFRRLERPFFRQHGISLHLRMLVYTAMVTSVLLYGAEAWSLTAAQLDYLEVFHRSRLRMILGVRRADRLSTPELLRRCGATSIAAMLDRRQLRWLGHVGRMDSTRIAKQAMYGTLAGAGRRRRRGAPTANLCARFQSLTRQYLNGRQLREAGLPRGATWWDACQNRPLFKGLIP
jgi:hypothetical protein